MDVNVDEWSDLTLAHERLDVYRRAIEFLADAVQILALLPREWARQTMRTEEGTIGSLGVLRQSVEPSWRPVAFCAFRTIRASTTANVCWCGSSRCSVACADDTSDTSSTSTSTSTTTCTSTTTSTKTFLTVHPTCRQIHDSINLADSQLFSRTPLTEHPMPAIGHAWVGVRFTCRFPPIPPG